MGLLEWMSPSFIPSLPPLLPKIPVLFHCETKRNVIAFLFPGQLYPLLSTKHGTEPGTAPAYKRSHRLESPGMRQHELKVPTNLTASAASWQVPKRLPRVPAAQLSSHMHFTTTDQHLLTFSHTSSSSPCFLLSRSCGNKPRITLSNHQDVWSCKSCVLERLPPGLVMRARGDGDSYRHGS